MENFIVIGTFALGIIGWYFWIKHVDFIWDMMENDWKAERQENKELELLLNTPMDWRTVK